MTRQDYIKDQLEKQWPERFKDHVAMRAIPNPQVPPNPIGIEFIEWRNPGTWNYACRYMIQSCWLFAYGDLFEATYQWSEAITWEFLAGLDFGYFLSKCRASPTGGKFASWDEAVAQHNLKEYEAEIRKHCEDGYCDVDSAFQGTRDYVEEAARKVYDGTGDAELASAISSSGLVPDTMALGHFVGIKMAVAQLKKGAG